MIHEQEFICWHPNLVEADGKEVMATTIRDAAKKAVAMWRKEKASSGLEDKIVVQVKDEARRIHQITIH